MKRNTRINKPNIPMCLACFLLCLTLISVFMISGLYAKYTVKGSGSDGARVVRFGDITLTESGDFANDGQGMIIPGVGLTKRAVVSFTGSEASTYIFVKIALSGWQTEDKKTYTVGDSGGVQMNWSIENGWTFLSKSDSDNTYIYYLELPPNETLEKDIIADGGKITVSDKITRENIEKMKGISITFSAAAVQSNGFESPEAAWDSLAAKRA